MATCTECGTENVEGAKYCINCAATLGRMGSRERCPRDECFGLPHGGAIEIWTYAIIIIGLIMVAGAIYGLTRRGS